MKLLTEPPQDGEASLFISTNIADIGLFAALWRMSATLQLDASTSIKALLAEA